LDESSAGGEPSLGFERTLLEAHPSGLPEFDLPASWHYSIVSARHRFTQHIFHYPDEGGYRMRIFYYPPRPPSGEYLEEELWTFASGLFDTPEEALSFGGDFLHRWENSV
jgi:hypothetical protein